ncbi:hypothetical protein HMPREF9413_1242 [Paenibacillus sp. HGF7]|nr:hypothetical protein HMPREF9413_1242 [Paenibacillus sp. HGF7]
MVILNKDTEEPLITDVGDLSYISFIVTSEQLFTNELVISVKKSDKSLSEGEYHGE